MVPYLADGSGSYLATTALENGFTMDMTVGGHSNLSITLRFQENECRDLIIDALLAGMKGKYH